VKRASSSKRLGGLLNPVLPRGSYAMIVTMEGDRIVPHASVFDFSAPGGR
jgi:hypothetical protein